MVQSETRLRCDELQLAIAALEAEDWESPLACTQVRHRPSLDPVPRGQARS